MLNGERKVIQLIGKKQTEKQFSISQQETGDLAIMMAQLNPDKIIGFGYFRRNARSWKNKKIADKKARKI